MLTNTLDSPPTEKVFVERRRTPVERVLPRTERHDHNLLGVRVDAADYASAVQQVIAAARAPAPLAVTALAVHGLMCGALDPEQRYRLNHFDLVLPDGQPVRWALNWLYRTGLRERVYGPRFMLELCRRAASEGLPIFLYGCREDLLDDLSRNLCDRFPGLTIAGMRASRFRPLSRDEQDELAREVRASGARLMFVGLGCPRQEMFAYEFRQRAGIPLVAVGAAFAMHAGHLPQAPARMQRMGLEWLFRLCMEPRRLWKRYLLLNPLYLLLVALQALHIRRLDPHNAVPPTESVCPG